MTAHLGSDIKL